MSAGTRTTIRMKPDLARRAKAYARRSRQTFTQVVEEAVTRLLDEGKTPAVPLPEIPVVHGLTPIDHDTLKRVIEQLDDEDDLRRIGVRDEPTSGR